MTAKPDLRHAIAIELYKACENLGAGPELLAVIGSYGDTLDDEDILFCLKDYNASGDYLKELTIQ